MEVASMRYGRTARYKPKRPKWPLLVVFALLLAAVGSYVFLALHKPLPPLTFTATALPAYIPQQVELEWPAGTDAAIGSVEQGVLAVSSTMQSPRPMASITKLFTALTIRKSVPYIDGAGRTFTMTAKDEASYRSYASRGGSVLPVVAGQQISEQKALEALLIISANNIADTLVERSFDSTEDFLSAANALAQELGMNQTTIADASGFSAGSVSTPSDLILLGRAVLADPVLAAIVATPVQGQLRNTNPLLGDLGVIGIKTGTTDEAGRCLLFASRHSVADDKEVVVIGAVMGAASQNALAAGSRKLLQSAYNGFGPVEVLPEKSLYGSFSSAWGRQGEVRSGAGLLAYGWRGSSYDIDIQAETSRQAPLSGGTAIGVVQLEGGDVLSGSELATQTAIPTPSLWWRLTHYF